MNTLNKNKHLYGAIIGDIVGSAYEFSRMKSYNFELFPNGSDFTDDTILTCATANTLIYRERSLTITDFMSSYQIFAGCYPHPKGSYGASFSQWVNSCTHLPYFSMGNGAAMRVSPCAYVSDDLNVCLYFATLSASATHNHWQGIRAAQAVVAAIFYLNHGDSVESVVNKIESLFCYNKIRPYVQCPDLFEAYRNNYEYTELAEDTVVGAMICALTATSFEDAIRRAVSLGGDADTLACIAGSIAEARFEIPDDMIQIANSKLPEDLREIVKTFNTMI